MLAAVTMACSFCALLSYVLGNYYINIRTVPMTLPENHVSCRQNNKHIINNYHRQQETASHNPHRNWS